MASIYFQTNHDIICTNSKTDRHFTLCTSTPSSTPPSALDFFSSTTTKRQTKITKKPPFFFFLPYYRIIDTHLYKNKNPHQLYLPTTRTKTLKKRACHLPNSLFTDTHSYKKK